MIFLILLSFCYNYFYIPSFTLFAIYFLHFAFLIKLKQNFISKSVNNKIKSRWFWKKRNKKLNQCWWCSFASYSCWELYLLNIFTIWYMLRFYIWIKLKDIVNKCLRNQIMLQCYFLNYKILIIQDWMTNNKLPLIAD